MIWVPRRTLVCNKILEEAGVLGDVSVEEFPLHFVPLEQDVLSLGLEDSFCDIYLVRVIADVWFDKIVLTVSSEKTLHPYSSLHRHFGLCNKSTACFHVSLGKVTMPSV